MSLRHLRDLGGGAWVGVVPLHVVLAIDLLPADLPALPVVERHPAGRRLPAAAPPTGPLALPSAAAAPEAAAGGAAKLPVAAEVARVAEALSAVFANVAALV